MQYMLAVFIGVIRCYAGYGFWISRLGVRDQGWEVVQRRECEDVLGRDAQVFGFALNSYLVASQNRGTPI